ncbi:MAG: thioesterase family protein [Ignavibacteria bacterium]|nr:MAG: thioesterase family protein [Ignavibacteria bacterium]
MQPTKNISDFHHIYKVKVKFNEVDMLHIVNNAVYFNYFEQARIQYAKDAGLLPDNIFSEESLYYMVHNEINYLSPSFFDDELNIYTRISYIKHSSFGFEHIVENSKSKKIIAEGSGVSVHVNPVKRKSAIIPDDVVEKVKMFEPSVKILRP